MTGAYQADDFVLTLSDNDEPLISDLDSDVEAVGAQKGTKRKRAAKTAPTNKRQKRQQNRSPAVVHSDTESEEDERGVKDDALDSDFEFDVGANGIVEDVEEFDGWGQDAASTKKGDKKGVDLDAIIARRAEKKSNSEKVKKQETEHIDSDAEDAIATEDEDNEDDVEVPDFDDDELLAADTFGAEANSEDQGDDPEINQEDDENSDSESVASPTAHPDDFAAEDSDAASQTSVEDNAEEAAKRAAFFAPEGENLNAKSSLQSVSSFQQFSLSRPILRGLATLSFTTPTPIQVRAIPIALQGLDVVGSAVTGSGKTAAFLLPILERLLYRPRKVPTTRVAILMPTRELAVQCYNVAIALARFTDITFAQVVGGFSLREQETILKKRPDVVIATPGRFIDHMRNSASFAVENIEILVLDEADRMLETGFEDELNEILKTIPKGRQTMLFSATMTDSVDKLVRVGMNRPVRLSVDAKKSTTAGLTQEFVRLRPGREALRLATLCVLCQNFFTERTIIFFRQKKEAHRVRIVFGILGIKAGELHGSMSQEQRISAVSGFRDGKTTHLLATDLASRGLDIKNVAAVVNYEAPQTHEIYVHRVGRTARAGRSGRACTIAAEPDRKIVKAAVKTARTQGAKVVSRVMDVQQVDAMAARLEELESEIDEILKEEREEKQLATTESQLQRGENILKHQDEIMARPRRTWFESEKEKLDAKAKGRIELNGPNGSVVKIKGEKKKLSNKDRKRLDDVRERKEGKMWRKGKGSEAEAKANKRRSKAGKATAKGTAKGTGKRKGRR
ncbi:nucleolar DEAD-box protein required for synthesis of 60S ribosomal subunit [Cladophialophora chaetospira]|uniref:RNA helicase n=1 Tax=Cladophialophora chaetospira TaxID=386627 RepID=A0AA38X8Z9_9EURO|nr:nucleolar DEAD-box protein required for synthesis of 60S ribosomal subunit [Cladophialophora chaetospira]